MKPNSLIYVLALALAGVPLCGQTPDADPEESGPGVARISLMNGEVSVKRGDSGDLIAAAINAPLVVTDRLLTGPNSRAEVQFDWANMIRIGANAEVRFSELDYKRYQVQIAVGTTSFRVLRDSDAQVEISTPSVSVRPLQKGVYRVTVLEDGSSEITVRSGEADIYTPTGSHNLRPGETMLARGAASEPEYQVQAAIPKDDWDNWNESRDRALERSQSYKYVARDVYGAEDLDGYGTWVQDNDYGWVWRPAVAVGWAPYRYGRWVWVDFYGWTWVSYDPWGWAPYHYGRWYYAPHYGWCWWPGQYRVRHYWRPALVAFFGWGGHHGGVSVGFGWGNIGWIPLAPHERYHPWYGRGWYGGRQTVINNITVVNNTNIFHSYRNGQHVNAITAVSADNFGRGSVGRHNLVRFNHADLEKANVVRGALPFTPTRESVRFADRTARADNLPRVGDSRRFFSRRQASPARTVPFEQQQAAVERIAHRTFGGPSGRADHAAPGGPSRAVESAPARGAAQASPPSRAGWRRVGEDRAVQGGANDVSRGAPRSELRPRGNTPAEAAPGASNGGRGAWRRFGGHSQPGGTVERPQTTDRSRQQAAPANPSPSRSESGGWQPFGRSRRESAAPSAPRTERSAPSSPPRVERSTPSPPPRVERSAPAADRPSRGAPGRGRAGGNGWMPFSNSGDEGPRSSSFDTRPRTDNPDRSPSRRSDRDSRSLEPIRIKPPIVRERSESRSRFQGNSGSSRFGGFEPRQSSAPRSGGTFSAPSRRSGGGGFAAPRSGGAHFGSRGGGGHVTAPSRSGGGGGGGRSRGGGHGRR